MKLKLHEELDKKIYTLEIEKQELIEVKLFKHDKILLDDCSKKGRKISDILLGLELLSRRIEDTEEDLSHAKD